MKVLTLDVNYSNVVCDFGAITIHLHWGTEAIGLRLLPESTIQNLNQDLPSEMATKREHASCQETFRI